mgnify:CR=1 FL=1
MRSDEQEERGEAAPGGQLVPASQITPCPTCPWRKSTRTADIPGGGLDRERSARTLGDLEVVDGRVVSGLTVMKCHCRETACAGFVVQVGFDLIGLRLACRVGVLSVDDYSSGGADLWPTFDAMLRHHELS